MSEHASLVGPDQCGARVVDPGRVTATRARLLSTREAGELAGLFGLLADPTRVRILYGLLEAGELCVCDLAAVVEASETAVSHALRLLRTAGVVRNRRDGRMVFYRLDDAHVHLLLDVSREHLRHEAG
ncbi:MAG: metalloregulator ArsR/SmtB family transcription factor [Actinomycetota bacterium]|nr:metalloregulator ArsR/SmtB family transcription factor [Actinomycetota bacterium]